MIIIPILRINFLFLLHIISWTTNNIKFISNPIYWAISIIWILDIINSSADSLSSSTFVFICKLLVNFLALICVISIFVGWSLTVWRQRNHRTNWKIIQIYPRGVWSETIHLLLIICFQYFFDFCHFIFVIFVWTFTFFALWLA
jgi:hypothetical protein